MRHRLLRTALLVAAMFAISGAHAGAASSANSAAGTWQVVYPHRPDPLFHLSSGIGVDRKHNVYVLDVLEGRERKFSPGGKLLAIWSLPYPELLSIWQPGRLAVDVQGNSYVLQEGVLKYSPAGRLLAHWTPVSNPNPISIAAGGSGNVFLLSLQSAVDGPGGNPRIDKYSPQGTLLASWYGPPLSIKSVVPDGLAVDPHGSVYVTVATDNVCEPHACIPVTSYLYRFSPAGKLTWTFQPARGTLGPVAAADGQGRAYLLVHDVSFLAMQSKRLSPAGRIVPFWPRTGGPEPGGILHVALDGKTIYLADSRNTESYPAKVGGMVRILDPAGRQLTQWGRLLPAQHVPFNLGMAVGPGGNIYATGSIGDAAYRVISPAGKLLRVVGHTSTAANAPVQDPRSIRLDAKGNVYIVDGTSGHVVKFSPAGKIVARWALPGAPTVGADDLALDPAGDIYVTAPGRIFKLSPQGRLLTTINGTGAGGIAIDAQDNLYVTDTYNNRVQKLAPDGTVLQTIGGGQYFDRPIRLTLDRAGNLYVIDLTHYEIQRFSPSGDRLAVLGEPGILPGQFDEPDALAFDRSGNLYVLDYSNNRIQRLSAG